ncbi:MAG: Ig-like domain-containing protein, partial [Patescibacteria group bacterium]
MSVRVTASGSTISSVGTDRITVNENIKNSQGRPNANTSPTPIFGGMRPLVISEIKAGAAADEYDEFIELYNRSSDAVPTSTIKLHLLNANGTVDTNVNLTFLSTVSEVPAHKFLLIAPITSSASTTADAVYTTSTLSTIIADGAAYISNSSASSTAVIDKVCWGSHSNLSDCEGSAISSLSNNGTSAERKAFNSSTSVTMGTGGADAAKGNSVDTQNNVFDFVVRTTPEPQNSRIDDPGEVPSGGSYGGESNGAPSINFAPIFRASKDAALNLVARIYDDGGPVTAGNTQLIYCTTDTTCAPASSTPIYGTSIGSGWYKFSSTSTNAWSNNKAYFKYYLQASDSATPAKTRVFTNDPSFDMNTYDTAGTGIQTAALQQSKAVEMSLVSGNLGSASISGTVNNSSGSALSGATVWIDGTQYAATTGNDGTFSFSNVGPSGGSQLKIAKEGYADQSLSFFIPSSGLVSLPTIILYSGMMGQGGDYNMPKITNTTPSMGMSGFQTQTPQNTPPAIEVNFSKTMDVTTITDSDASNAGSAIYLTLAGSETKIAGAVSGTATKATFIPTATLTAGKAYTLFVTPAVKDTVGNPVSGNGQGGSYVLMFSTAGQMYTAPENITNFGQGDSFPPYVVGSQPSPGKSNVVLNTEVFISFSEAMQNTASNIAKVKLYKVTSPFTASESKALVSTTNSIDASNKIVILSFSNLDASSHYRVEVLGGITSSKGIPLGNPSASGYDTSTMFVSDFETGTSSDDTAPTISGTIPAASATGVSTIKPVVISFSEAMDPTTITESSVSLKLGSTVISGDLSYDPNSWMATFVPDFSLTPTSTYTITVTTDVKNLSGLALASSLMRTFTTGSTDSTSPMVTSAQANEYSLKVTFSKPMLASTADDTVNYAYSVLKASNYSVRVVNSSGVAQSTVTLPSTATVNYDNSSRSVAISGLPTITGLTAGTTLINIVVSNVKDIAYNNLSSSGNAATTTAQSSQKTGNFSSSFCGAMGPMMNAEGNIIQGGMTSGMSAMVGTYGTESGIGFIPGVKVYPFSPMAGMISTYGVEAPISYQIPANGFIDITFPEGTDVSQAKKDVNSPPNNDINGSNLGAVVFATSEGTLPSGWTTGGQSNDGVIVDSAARIVRVILGAVATRSENSDTHDFLRLDIAQITNSTLSRSVDTSGNNATVETKKSDGTVIETLSSGAFFTSSAGTLTLRGQIKSGSTGLNGVKVFLMSPATGSQSTTTLNNKFGGNDGEFQFENLPSGSFMLGVDRYFKTADGEFMSNPPNPVMLNSTTCVSDVCTQNVSVTDASGGAAVTLGITGTFNNATIDIFAGGPGFSRMVTSTLNGALENDTSNSIKLNSNGVWMVGFNPSMSTEMFSKTGTASSSNWMAPRPQQVIVSGCPAACVANPSTVVFSSSAAGKMVKFTVKDASGNALGQSHVVAYSPGLGMGSDTQAGADGTGSINLSYGTYKIGADVPGMPSSIERTIAVRSVSSVDKVFIDGSSTGINLGSMTAANLILTVSKPDYTISGRVTDGTNPISNVPVNAYRTDGPGHAEAATNSSGDYTLYVGNGTWKAQAMMPDYGKLAEKTITVNGASVSSQNFQPNTTSVNYGTLTKSVYVDTNNDGAYVAADDEELSNAQVTVKGATSGGETYFNTALTDTNGSSTLKLPPGTYTMDVWSPTLG